MYYAPHTLYVRTEEVERDEYGRPIKESESWRRECRCRCDEERTKEITDKVGKVHRASYKVVCEGNRVTACIGDLVRVLDGDNLHSEGIVLDIIHNNKLNYSVIWL